MKIFQCDPFRVSNYVNNSDVYIGCGIDINQFLEWINHYSVSNIIIKICHRRVENI